MLSLVRRHIDCPFLSLFLANYKERVRFVQVFIYAAYYKKRSTGSTKEQRLMYTSKNIQEFMILSFLRIWYLLLTF